MNHNIKYLILGLAVLGGLTACNKQLIEEPQAPVNTHRVYFSSSTAQTKTGITIAEGTMTPDWRATNADNVHLFEIGSNGYSVGKDVTITPADDNLTAHFKADFPTDMTIIVDPSKKNSLLTASNESNAGPYTYAAIVAQATESAYIVPAVQNPGAETLIDPNADFLIGYSRKSYDAAHNWEEDVVDLYFDRPVALGRIIISSFEEGEKVKSVVIKAPGLSGSAAYTAIDFENAAVTFTPDVAAEGETAALTLAYGDAGRALTDGTFDAYFVALPGKPTVSEIVVTTDKWVYTKTVGKEITFSKDSFKNLTLNLASATKEAAAPTEIKWYKASVLEDGIDYLIVSGGYALKNNGSKAVVAAQAVEIVDGTISLEETDGLIWTANANSGFTEYGTHTLSNGTEHLWRHSDNGKFTLEANNEAITKYMVWNYDGEYLWNISIYTGSGSAQISDYYAYYSSGWKTSTTKTAATLYTSRAPQELAFTPAANAEYDLATSEWTVAVPTLSGAQTSVTYALSEDSNPAVATVDTDGTVRPLSRGTVTIVATATGNDQYQAASASYTLRVVDSSVTTNTYIKVTSTSDLEVGAKYLLVFEGLAGDTDGDGNPKVFKPILNGNTFSKDTGNALDVEIESGTITSDEFEGSHLTLESGYYLKADAVNRYLYPTGTSSGSGTLSAEATATNKLTIAFDNGIAQIKVNSGSNYLVWSTSSHYFSSNAQVSGSYSTGICLYKLDDGRQAQTLSFDPVEATYDLYTPSAFVKPSLSTAHGTVTYSSSDATIAEVDNSGNITGKKKGTVTITATAAGDTQYKPGSASYTLTVENSDPSAPTDPVYTKVMSSSDLVLGGKYLIVNSDATKVFKPALNGSSFDATSANAIAEGFTVDGNTIVSSELDACQVVINTLSSGYSIYVPATSTYWYLTRGNMGSESSASTSHYSSITVDNGSVTIKRGSSNYYMRYSTNDNYFYESSTSSTVTLYRLDDGSNPGGGDDSGDDPGEEKYYVLVTSEPASWDGTYLIVNTASDGSGSAMNGTGTASVTISGGKIRSTSTVDGYALTVTSAGEVHPNQPSGESLIAYDIQFNDNDYLFWFSNAFKYSANQQTGRDGLTYYRSTLKYDNGVRIMSAGYPLSESYTPGIYYLYYQSSGSYTMAKDHSGDRVQLYRLENP